MWSAARDQFASLPSAPRAAFVYLLMLLPLMPATLVRALESPKLTWLVHLGSLGLSVTELLVALVQRWAGSGAKLGGSAAKLPRSSRETFEALWLYAVDSLRWLVVALVVLWLGITVMCVPITLYVLYLVVWGREESRVAAMVKRAVRALWSGFAAPQQRTSADADGDTTESSQPRKTSLKGGSHSRCVVVDEGPSFDRRARGCLLR